MIRLLIVDSQELIREGLRRILADYPFIKVVAEASNGESALRLSRKLKPEVVLMDVDLPGLTGFEVTGRLRQGERAPRVIILTVHKQPPFPKLLLEAGAAGYLTKGCPAVELVQAIRAVASGKRHVGAEIAQQMALDMMPGAEATPFDGLSAREMEVMLLLADGRNLADIAKLMSLSPKTVATYKYRIYDKLNTRNDVDMTRMAMRYGVVAPA
jgi:two-component system invasion response regulator UvrY